MNAIHQNLSIKSGYYINIVLVIFLLLDKIYEDSCKTHSSSMEKNLQTYVIIQSKYSEVLICKKGLIQAFINQAQRLLYIGVIVPQAALTRANTKSTFTLSSNPKHVQVKQLHYFFYFLLFITLPNVGRGTPPITL